MPASFSRLPPTRGRRTPPRGRREALRLGAGALAAVALAACSGGGDGGADAEASPSATTTPPTPAADPLPLATGAPPPEGPAGGMLRFGVVGEPDAPPAFSYATLVAVDPRDAAVHGDLAEAVEQPDALTVAFRIRPSARFHEHEGTGGGPIAAAEVARDFGVRAAAGEFLFARAVSAIEVPGPLTLTLRLGAPFALLFERLGDSAAAGVRAGAPSPVGTPLGSGPFMPRRLEDGGLSLLPHPGYHRLGLPALGEIRIVSADRERTLDAAFAHRALDMRALDGPEAAARAAEREDAAALARPSRRVRGLGLSLVGSKGGRNVRFHPAFQDERVRRAAALALDRQSLAARDGAALAGPVGPGFAADALGPAELAAHPAYRHDPAEAARLLAAAGYEGLAFVLEAPSVQPLAGLAALAAAQLREAGFAPRLEPAGAERLQQDLEAGDFEAILFELEAASFPDFGLRLHVSGGPSGEFSPWGFSHPAYDDAVSAALGEIEPGERARRSRDAQRLLLEAAPALLTLPEPVERVAVAEALRGYEYGAYGFNERALAERWRLGGGEDGA